MSYLPGTNLTFDDNGFLYEPDLRDLVGESLEPDQVIAVEAVLAIRHAARVLDRFMRGLGNRYGMGDDRMKVLARLHEHRTGLPLRELQVGLDRANVQQILDQAERAGIIARTGGGQDPRSRVRLTEQGLRLMDELLRQTADRITALIDGVGLDQLAAVRHVCLWMSSNRELLQASDGVA
jgi:DNA-binding MarR family transcriptional regulator